MSVRYGISVTLEPAFSAGLHRARQVTCSQYGCWAAEMHSVHVPLTGYFPCPEEAVLSLDARLEDVAQEFQKEHPGVRLSRRVDLVHEEAEGSIYVEFDSGEGASPESLAVEDLRNRLETALTGLNLAPQPENYPLRFALLQYAGLPLRVFESAARFAAGVVDGLGLAASVDLAELVIFRYESDAAGENWDGGGWAADLRWQVMDSFPLSGSQARYPNG